MKHIIAIIFLMSYLSALSAIINLDFGKIDNSFHINNLRNSSIDYVSELNLNELFEFAYELAEIDSLDFNCQIFVPFIKTLIRNDNDINDTLELISQENFNPKFRAFLIDIVTKEISTKDTSYFDNLQQILLSVASETSADPFLRGYALMQLRSKTNELYPILTDLMNSSSEPEVISSLLTAMRRTNHPDLEENVSKILSQPENYDDEILRHAAVSIAKSGLGISYVSHIGEIATTTESRKVYNSMIYSLGLIRDPESVCEIVNSSGRYDEKILIYSILINQITVENMVRSDQGKKYIINGLKAIQIANIPFNESVIYQIKSQLADPEIDIECEKTLKILAQRIKIGNEDFLQKLRGE